MKMNLVNDVRLALLAVKERSHNPDEMLEIVNASFIADQPSIFGSVNQDYVAREHEWYMSQSLNVNDIPGTVPQIWQNVSDKDGFINSNYGWCQFSGENYNQYHSAIANLSNDPASRQGAMIFTRPSMHIDAVANGRSDFMCTYAHQLMIRNGKLNYHVYMRSNDAVFGYNNDKAWADYVWKLASDDLGVPLGTMYWNAASLHVYPRHRHLVTA